MPWYEFRCDACQTQWEIHRDMVEEPPQVSLCPHCQVSSGRFYRPLNNMNFKPYWTDGLNGKWEWVDSKSTENRRCQEEGKVRLRDTAGVHRSSPEIEGRK